MPCVQAYYTYNNNVNIYLILAPKQFYHVLYIRKKILTFRNVICHISVKILSSHNRNVICPVNNCLVFPLNIGSSL